MSNHKECETEVTGGDIDILQEDCQSMQQEIDELHSKNGVAAFGREAFFDCDTTVLFYTGLPNQRLLKIVFTICMSVLPVSENSALTPFQEMTLRGQLYEQASPVTRAASASRAGPVSIELHVICKNRITWRLG